MFCSKCGKQINVNSGFCPSCGNPINNVNYQNVNYQNFNYQNVNYQNQVNSKPKKPIGKIITVSVLALCLIGLVVYALLFGDPYRSKKEQL